MVSDEYEMNDAEHARAIRVAEALGWTVVHDNYFQILALGGSPPNSNKVETFRPEQILLAAWRAGDYARIRTMLTGAESTPGNN